jgi:transcription antitermination factor NusG
MPLLKRETEHFPPALFEGAADRLPWWVGHVRSRQEKAVARYLEPRDVGFFLPQGEKRVVRQNRARVSHLPLFPGYIFFRGTLADRQTALRSQLLVRVIEVGDQELLGAELRQLHELRLSGASLVPLHDFAPGDAVRITEGPFQGYSGVIVWRPGRPRLVVSVSMLGKAVEVEFDRDVLAPHSPVAASATESTRSVFA